MSHANRIAANRDPHHRPSAQTDSPRAIDSPDHTGMHGQWLALLQGLTRACALENRALDEVLREFCPRLCNVLQAQQVSFWCMDDSGTKLECLEHYSTTDPGLVSRPARTVADHPALFSALERGELIIAYRSQPDATAGTLWEIELADSPAAALVAVPVVRGGRLCGVMSVERESATTEWRSDECTFAQGVANTLSLRVEQDERTRIEQLLCMHCARTDWVYDQMPDLVLRIDRNLRFAFVNAAAARIVGRAPRELIGTNLGELSFAPNRLVDARRHVAEVLGEARPRRVNFTLNSPAGRRVFESVLLPELDTTGAGASVLLIASDVTDRIRDQRALAEREERFRVLAQLSSDYYWEQDAQLRFTVIEGRQPVESMPESTQLIGKRRWELPDDSVTEEEWAAHKAVLAARQPFRDFEIRRPDRHGESLWFSISGQPKFGRGGRFEGYRGVARNITLRKRAELSLQAATRAAQQANLAKSRYLAQMSHEIRTPMSAILGTLEILVDSALPASSREHASAAYESAEALLGVINDVLDLSKIEAGKLTLCEAPFQLRRLLQSVLTLFEARAIGKGVALTQSVEAHLTEHWIGDAGRLRQVLSNLVGNALRFTDHGRVAITVSGTHEPIGGSVTLRFAVTDTGVGIPTDNLARLFAPVVQVGNDTTRSNEGTGLGLAISKQLVDRMGGAIGVASEPGRGSTFWFDVRLVRSDAAQPTADHPPATQAQAIATLAGRTTLLVEDNAINRKIAAIMLRELGCEVTAVENGAQALEQVRPGRFDVVLMDWHMPVLGGIEATAMLRDIERNHGALGRQGDRLCIVALTANSLSGDRERALQSGFDEYIAKPFRKVALRDALLHVLRRAATPQDRSHG